MTYIFTNRLSHKVNWLTKLFNKYALSVILLFVTTNTFGQNYSGGNGTSIDPYQIANKTDLKYLSEHSGDWSKHFKQTADIIFTNADFESGGDFYNSGEGFIPLGTDWGTTFSGSYDGSGHKITNLFISRGSTDYVGLFGLLSGALKNLGLENADITGHDNTGGLVGRNQNNISNCYLTGSVNGANSVGGIVGYCTSTVSNSYSTGTITGSGSGVGGIAGQNYSIINNCFAAGSVGGSSSYGAFVGWSGWIITNSFWDSEIMAAGVGGGSSAGIAGKTTTEMKTQSTFTDAGWDFTNESTNGNNDYWKMDSYSYDGYPYLSWQPEGEGTPPTGSGTLGDPYQIETLANLYWLSQQQSNSDGTGFYWSRNYIQTANIDASASSDLDAGNGWTPIGNTTRAFTGTYDGDGHSIEYLYISRGSTDYIGLFGIASGSSARIKNLGTGNVNITGRKQTGGLVGLNTNNAIISNCYSTGFVNGSYEVGGLVGYNYNGAINNCYSTVSVTGSSSNIGGLVGNNNASSTIANCYSTGNVSSVSNAVGGLAGTNRENSSISNSYALGTVSGSAEFGGLVGYNEDSGTISNSFWNSDITTTGIGGNSGTSNAAGKSTAQLKTQSTFTDGGWDFTGESTNGNNDYWEMNSGFNNGYPILSWQSVELTGVTTTPEIVSKSNIGFTAQGSSISLIFVEMNAVPTKLPGGAVTINKYWEVSDISGGSVKLRLYYLTLLTSSFSGTPTIIHYNGSNWEVLPTEAPLTVGSLSYVETTNYYSSFSPVTVGDNASPLPVELVSFTGELADNTVVLNWKTATEVNNYGFEIQTQVSSSEYQEWTNVGFVLGNGTTNSPKQYSFTDTDLPNADEVNYRLKQIDNDGTFTYSKIVTVDLSSTTGVEDNIKYEFALQQNYPNPFNPSTTINFSIPENGKVILTVYNSLGQKIKTLVQKEMVAGEYQVDFNASELPSGFYTYHIDVDGKYRTTKKMLMIK